MDRDRALRSVPSWVNEKAIGVPVNRTLWVATTFSATLFLIIGFSGSVYADVLQGPVTATCYRRLKDPLYNCPNSLLQVFTEKATAAWASSPVASVVLQTSVYGFPIFSIVSSIPVFSIIVKYNLVENGFSPRSGFLWGVVFPWLAGFPLLYMPDVLGRVINITSLVFVSFANFVLPLALYVVLQRQRVRSADGRTGMGATLIDAPFPIDAPPSHDLEQHRSTLNPASEPAEPTTTMAESGRVSDWSVNELDDPSSPVNSAGCEPKAMTHYALPRAWAPTTKTLLATCLAVVLSVGSMAALVLTIGQGNYDIDVTSCAITE